MVRISGVNLPPTKQIEIGLTYVLGIGRTLSKKILKEAGIEPDRKVDTLKSDEAHKIQEIITASYKVEGDIRKIRMMSIKRLKDIDSWRGLRHKKGLPVRGQTTRVNSRTARGNVRKTVGSGRKGAPAPK
ncbi:MAG: 30S ribosomal protein S13 [Patescibacteria group bacterium]|nr:30S ribosomal protein S13 [Patescibacteria group bacterium]